MKSNISLLPPDQISLLNPGIRGLVQWLRAMGFDTRDSGDGKTHEHECDLPCPYVHISVDPPERLTGETDRLIRLLNGMGVDLTPMESEEDDSPHVEACYLPATGTAWIHLLNFTLHPDQCDYGKAYRGDKSKEEWAAEQNAKVNN